MNEKQISLCMQEVTPCNQKESGRQHPHHLTLASLNAAQRACSPVKHLAAVLNAVF